ncbi:hypothetical protein FRC04_010475 [Tulasnella sp. 424]|nr:hypothetical protein FRC04_010475 [Tulasnella sp. 424]KAG8978597.1 hypothetical protein FRC05_009869 [Tulasnella sp. 425]
MATTIASAVMPPHSSHSPDPAAIVSGCAAAVQTALRDLSEPRVLLFDDCVVEFNNAGRLLNEGDTQAFVYAAALESSPNAPRVPEVYGCFSWDGIRYLVMERVNHPTVEAWIKDAASEAEAQARFDKACQAVADALRWLFALSPPGGSEIGLIEGAYAQRQSAAACAKSGRARHRFFGDDSAPFRYTGAPALERHINAALGHRPRSAPPRAVEMSNEPLVMVQGDINPLNFLIDPWTLQVTIIDFGCVSALPHSFVSFTLYSARNKFTACIAELLGWKRSE